MAKTTKHQIPLTHDEIAARAQRIYDLAGRPEGKAEEHWLQAESQLIAERKVQAAATGKSTPKPMPDNGDGWRANSPARQTAHRS